MTTSLPSLVRFDNVVDGVATVLSQPVAVIQTYEISDVTRVLGEVEAAVRTGRYAAGFVTYEAAAAFPDGFRLAQPVGSAGLPLAWFALYDPATVVTTSTTVSVVDTIEEGTWTPDVDQPTYEQRVRMALEEVAAGVLYQVNLTTPLRRRGPIDLFTLYQSMVATQAPRYGMFIETPRWGIASASPELFFDWDGSHLRVRPMKGTAARGRYAAEDVVAAHTLRSSEKEIAENVMIVDLMRNDLGRVARTGSVCVDELCALEAYPGVWQLVSDVVADTCDDVGLVEIFSALFPCGSVTGAPKSSAMTVIERLEGQPRGIYCGALGLLSPRESGLRATFSVGIRTAQCDRETDLVRYGSGGGIVADSDPTAEYEEMLLKARVVQTPPHSFSLFETFRAGASNGHDHVKRHLERLTRSAEQFNFTLPRDLESSVQAFVNQLTLEQRVKLTLARDGTVRWDLGDVPRPRDVVRLCLDDDPVNSADFRLFHKTTQREVYESRRARWADVDDVVLINERGECTETSVANFAALVEGQWCTPPLSSGLLPGIQRALLLAEGTVVERVLFADDLRTATALMVFNSLRGTEPARLTDGSRQ